MALLEIALAYCLLNEGKISDVAGDRGGLTNAGITIGTYSTYLGRPATRDEVINMTDATKADVYRKFYWAPIKGDSIKDQGVATVYFDMAVNMGPAQATKIVQSIIGATQDGICGPKTLAALNAAEPRKFVVAFSQKCCQFYGAITVRDPTQAQFLSGWQIRAHRMIRDIVLA